MGDLIKRLSKMQEMFDATQVMSLLGGDESSKPAAILQSGIAKCRGVTLSTISRQMMGGTNVRVGIGKSEALGVASEASTPAHRGDPSFKCVQPDFFVSHSWQDDGDEKWNALVEVNRVFAQENGREAVFWIDKFCIDQGNPEEGIKFLPVFLMACKRVLAIVGRTYLTRLWCSWELFTMSIAEPSMSTVIIWSIEDRSYGDIAKELEEFDPVNLQCTVETDKDVILKCMDGFRGGSRAFQEAMRRLADKLVQRGNTVPDSVARCLVCGSRPSNEYRPLDELETQRILASAPPWLHSLGQSVWGTATRGLSSMRVADLEVKSPVASLGLLSVDAASTLKSPRASPVNSARASPVKSARSSGCNEAE